MGGADDDGGVRSDGNEVVGEHEGRLPWAQPK
ncbi:hypothetical protein F441_12950 [Phytophthora nicotianae CJ01A1]|uniref:Uncharacterized protein n=3 Tax=Phytophthora nicotianae TaxID=4792 RepID=W2R5I3_PHYN3|nr:hypothetical protein PPTG_21198 [Phytophthora nicotianae INRA-310]ETK81832.1 hypothetical protein L915_12690 [Phytophthora nicotianae]ETN19969.1 hypothetical protein PPTG_21198 [Phytophthora nicotianae INRA-310]ETP11537.1 hypothetical protein F441_12950 [Phytophthora nicotianae CJ01A1]